MPAKKFAGFSYEGLNNIGDHIQSIASEQFVPSVTRRFNRDDLRSIKSSRKYHIIMNGWFSHAPENCFPPSPVIIPVFWGFHITNWNNSWEHFSSDESIEYLRKYSPIGCRDQYTATTLGNLGISTFYSKCLTLTLPKRTHTPKKGLNIIVDVPFQLPVEIIDNSIFVTHSISSHCSEEMKFQKAFSILKLYRDYARLVVTTRIHCALPCIAMGIPVIFLGNQQDYRMSIVKDVGLDIYQLPLKEEVKDQESLISYLKKLYGTVDWDPRPLNFEKQKKEIVSDFKQFLKKLS